MKKLLSIVLATLLLLGSFAAIAEETEETPESLINVALAEDRNVSIDATISTSEALGALNGATLHADAQFAGAPRLAVTVKNADEVLTDIMIGSDDANVYLRLSNISENTFSVSKATIMQTVISLLESADLSVAEVMTALVSLAEASEAQTLADVTPDLSNVDLTPMIPAMMAMMAKTTLSDVEDYSMDDEALSAEEPVELTEEAVEASEEDHGSISAPVAMTTSLVLDKDDLTLINNCIAATITLNADYAEIAGLDAEEIYNSIQAFIDSLTESVTVMINMDEDGCPVYVSVNFTFAGDEGENTSILMQAYNIAEGNSVTYAFDFLASPDSSDSYTSLFSAVCEVVTNEDSLNANAAVTLGNRVNGFALEAELNSTPAEQQLVIESVTYNDSERTVDLAINANGALEVDGVDFTANGSVAVYAQPETNTEPLIAITVTAATSDPVVENFDSAIALDQMDPAEEEDLQEDIAENIVDSVEDYSQIAEETGDIVAAETAAE